MKRLPGNVIFAGNHVSAFDPLLLATCLPLTSGKLPVVFVTHERQAYLKSAQTWRRHFYGRKFFKMLGGYPAYAGANDYSRALRDHLAALEAGRSVCIFPVGSLHSLDRITEARGGVSYLAKETDLPVIPFKIEGAMWHARPIDHLRRRPKLDVLFGEPLRAQDIFDCPLAEVKQSDREKFRRASVELMRRLSNLRP